MSSVNLTIIPPDLTSYCFTSWNQLAIDMVGGAVVQFDTTGYTGVLKQSTTPGATQRNLLWYNTATDHLLRYDNAAGLWVMRHPEAPGSNARRLFVGLAASIDTYDGGSTGAVGDATGPMWEIDTQFAARFPVGVGTFPLSATAVAVLGTGGLDQLTLAQANLPAVKVTVNTDITGNAGVTGAGGQPVVGATYGQTPIAGNVSACDATDDSSGLAGCYKTKGQTDNLGSGTPITSVPPYIGVYFLKRTARLYYTS